MSSENVVWYKVIWGQSPIIYLKSFSYEKDVE